MKGNPEQQRPGLPQVIRLSLAMHRAPTRGMVPSGSIHLSMSSNISRLCPPLTGDRTRSKEMLLRFL